MAATPLPGGPLGTVPREGPPQHAQGRTPLCKAQTTQVSSPLSRQACLCNKRDTKIEQGNDKGQESSLSGSTGSMHQGAALMALGGGQGAWGLVFVLLMNSVNQRHSQLPANSSS